VEVSCSLAPINPQERSGEDTVAVEDAEGQRSRWQEDTVAVEDAEGQRSRWQQVFKTR